MSVIDVSSERGSICDYPVTPAIIEVPDFYVNKRFFYESFVITRKYTHPADFDGHEVHILYNASPDIFDGWPAIKQHKNISNGRHPADFDGQEVHILYNASPDIFDGWPAIEQHKNISNGRHPADFDGHEVHILYNASPDIFDGWPAIKQHKNISNGRLILKRVNSYNARPHLATTKRKSAKNLSHHHFPNKKFKNFKY